MFEIRYAARSVGARTAYGVAGNGPVLLVPPSYLSHLEFWSEAPGAQEFLGCLTQRRKLVLYDRHGCGLSDRDRTDFTIEDDLQDIFAVVEALHVENVDILGVSGGTFPSLVFAARQPEKLRRLVLYRRASLRW